jgi:hypothetical protein
MRLRTEAVVFSPIRIAQRIHSVLTSVASPRCVSKNSGRRSGGGGLFVGGQVCCVVEEYELCDVVTLVTRILPSGSRSRAVWWKSTDFIGNVKFILYYTASQPRRQYSAV